MLRQLTAEALKSNPDFAAAVHEREKAGVEDRPPE